MSRSTRAPAHWAASSTPLSLSSLPTWSILSAPLSLWALSLPPQLLQASHSLGLESDPLSLCLIDDHSFFRFQPRGHFLRETFCPIPSPPRRPLPEYSFFMIILSTIRKCTFIGLYGLHVYLIFDSFPGLQVPWRQELPVAPYSNWS